MKSSDLKIKTVDCLLVGTSKVEEISLGIVESEKETFELWWFETIINDKIPTWKMNIM